MTYEWKKSYPGIWTYLIGNPQRTLTGIAGSEPARRLAELPETEPIDIISCETLGHYTVLRIPLQEDDCVFGCGLLFQHVASDNQVYHVRTDHYSGVDDGRTHAPVPFVALSNGIGLLCNTLAEVDIYVRTAQRKEDQDKVQEHDRSSDPNWSCYNAPYFVEIAVKSHELECVLFHGKNMKDCVARFNLYCGGGFVPPKWGMGLWHRTNMKMNQDQIREIVDDYKKHDVPLAVIGLEPGWQSNAYPCTYDWSEERFPNPEKLIADFQADGIRVNLWENPFISQKSTIYNALKPYSGSHLVWCGIVPDYTLPETRNIIKKHHETHHFRIGVSGYKLDESDGYDKWLWPDHAQFPSGLDGLAYRRVCGLLFQRMTYEIFHENNQRTFGLTRSSNAGGVRFPYVIYNDRYDFKEYVAGLCSCGFTGTLWCPEIRGAKSPSEWLRRFQLAAISPMLLLNAWANNAVPWMFPEVETAVCEAIRLRARLLPYLYSAFARYHTEGIPPFRSLFMDYGMFLNTRKQAQGALDDTENPYQEVAGTDIKDQFIVGDTLMAAPIAPEATSRKIIFPPGKWYDFHTGKQVASQGGVQEIECPPQAPLPLFAPDGAVIPILENNEIVVKKYGSKPGSFMLYDDDGTTFDYERGAGNWQVIAP